MKTISRYIMTLALLLTAVGGAWADEVKVTIDAADYDNTSTYTSYSKEKDGITITFSSARKNTSAFDLQSGSTVTITSTVGKIKSMVFYCMAMGTAKYGPGCLGSPTAGQYSYIDMTGEWTGEAESFTLTSSDKVRIEKIDFTVKDPNAVEVTTNAASKQDLFTEAWFNMPTFDATVNYMLVRDMQDETNPVAFSGLPTNDEPIVVKKGSDGKYQPAEALTIQLIDPLAAAETQNIIAADGITVTVEKKGDGDTWTSGTFADFMADMQPGTYRLTATPKDENSPYDGTVSFGEFNLVEKYDLVVKPANDFSKGKVESVTVGSGSVTIDANTGKATKTGIAPGTEVKIKAKRGYVIDKVEAKKGIAPPDPVTVTWNNLNFNSNPYTRDGVTLTAGNNSATGNAFYNYGDKTFTTTLGKFTKIEIVCEGNNFNGWAKESAGGYQIPEGPYVEVFRLTWTGNAESVTIPGGNYIYGISSITFTIQ